MERSSLLSQIEEKDALFCLSFDKINQELLDRAHNLKIIGEESDDCHLMKHLLMTLNK